MKANLTLFYSTNVYLNLIEYVEIENIDKITTEYINQDDFRNSERFSSKIDKFYINHGSYRNSIKNLKDKNGHLLITYYDQNDDFRKLRVLYKEDKVKMNQEKTVNAITKALKDAKSNKLILNLFREYDFIFGTEYNNHFYKLPRIKKELSYSDIPIGSALPKYNKLVKIVHDELIKGTDTNISPVRSAYSYYHIRLIDEYLERKEGLQTTNKRKIEISPSNIEKIENYTLKKETKPIKKVIKEKNLFDVDNKKFHGMGDLLLDMEDEQWRK